MTPTAKMRSPGAAKMRSRAVSARLILQRHRVVTEAMLSSYRGMRVILAGPQSRCFGPKRFCTPALGASSAFRSSSVTRSRRRSVCYWPAIPTRSATQAADCVFTQSTASKPALNSRTCSIVPSGHSASTCQYSPSLRTTQNIGIRAITFSPTLHGASGHVWRTGRKGKRSDQPVALPNLNRLADRQFSGLFNGIVVVLKRQMDSADNNLAVLLEVIKPILWHAYTLQQFILSKQKPDQKAGRNGLKTAISRASEQCLTSELLHNGRTQCGGARPRRHWSHACSLAPSISALRGIGGWGCSTAYRVAKCLNRGWHASEGEPQA
jgi:hypothetical protein